VPDAFTAGDALGLYLTGTEATAAQSHDASLGGARSLVEVTDLRWKISSPYPGVVVEAVSGACGEGTAYIRATAAGSLAFTAPGDTEGAAVAIANGESKVLESGGSASKWVRVYRASSTDFAFGTSLGMRLKLVQSANNAIAHDNVTDAERTAGHNSYRGLMLWAHGGVAIDNIKVWIGDALGTEVGWEAPSTADLVIQVIANDTTAPTGVTFDGGTTSGTGLSLARLEPWESYGLWIHRTVAAATPATHEATIAINLQYDVAGVTYTRQYAGRYGIADDSLVGYVLYAGEDAPPDFAGAAAATSATEPFTYALTPPGSGTTDFRLVCRWRNAYGLISQNVYSWNFEIDSTGALVNSPLAPPEDVTLTQLPGGYVDVEAVYYAPRDASPADTFRVYSKAAADPAPGVDTPAEVLVSPEGIPSLGHGSMWGAPVYGLKYRLGPYAWGTDLRVLVTAYRSSDGEESTNTTATQATITTVAPNPVAHRHVFVGGDREIPQAPWLNSTTTIHAESNTRILMMPGEALFLAGSVVLWRATWPDTGRNILYVPNAWALIEDDTSWGAGTGSIEYVAGPPVVLYLVVNGTRRAKIDVTNLTISAAEFGLGDVTLTDCPSSAAYVARSTELLFQVWDRLTGRYRSYLSVSSAGRLSTAPALWQRRA
jgi:hypothetical protein